jgi:hypothetical protein
MKEDKQYKYYFPWLLAASYFTFISIIFPSGWKIMDKKNPRLNKQ